MGYFPFFVDISKKRGLIVGGGAVALRKVRKLLPYGPCLTVVAPQILPAIRAIGGLTLLERAFEPNDLKDCDFAIAATDSRTVNQTVAALCTSQKILVNTADHGEDGSFVFPALVKRGELSVGISTGGGFPMAGVYIKEKLAELLPAQTDEILEWLCARRGEFKTSLPEKQKCNLVLSALCRAAMEQGRPLNDSETAAIVTAVRMKNGG